MSTLQQAGKNQSTPTAPIEHRSKVKSPSVDEDTRSPGKTLPKDSRGPEPLH